MTNRFLNALKGQNSALPPPIWLMRQAGRYMSEYRSLRSRYSFVDMCKEPDLIYKVTKLPIDAFDPDAAIIFSDILFIVESLGFKVAFEEGVGPIVTPCPTTYKDIDNLKLRDIGETLGFVFEGIKRWKASERAPLIGFAGAPFTVACYIIEGKMTKSFQKTKEWFYKEPKSFAKLLDVLTDATICYLNQQIEAGVDAIQIFDSWATLLPWNQYQDYLDRYLKKIVSNLKPCPVIYFCRGASSFYPIIKTLPIQAISLDWQCSLKEVRKTVHHTLQGNLDPEVLLATPAVVEREAAKILLQMQGDAGFIFNLGHGILPQTPVENVRALVSLVKNGRIS